MASESQVPYVLQLMLAGPKRTEEKINTETEGNRAVKTMPRCRKAGRKPLPLKSKHDSSVSITGASSRAPLSAQDVRMATRKVANMSLEKKKYVNWDPYKARIIKRYQCFRQKNKKAPIAKTLQFFKARGGIYEGLEYNHIKYWLKQKLEDCNGEEGLIKKRRGRPPILKGATLKMIDEVILRAVNSGKYLVTSTNLYPLIVKAIKECGEGHKLGKGVDKLKVCPTWINDRCCRLNLSMRKPTTATSKLPNDWKYQMKLYTMRLAYYVHRYGLKPEDVYNLDQTSVQLNPHANGGKTRSHIGSRDVITYNNDDKQQITVVPTVSAGGKKCPLQVIFKGTEGYSKTGKRLCGSIPDYKNDFVNLIAKYPGSIYSQTKNHWSTHETNIDLIEKIIVPFARQNKKMRRELGMEAHVSDKIVIVLDCWPVQATQKFRLEVQSKFPDVILSYLPPNLTGKLQPLDVSINSNFKQHIKRVFGEYAIQQDFDETFYLDGMTKERKRLAIDWIHQGWTSVKEETVVKAWKKAGLLDAWKHDVIRDAMDMFEEHKLFPKKQGSLSGFEMQPIPVGFDAPVGQNEKKYDNVLSETPMESDSCLTLTEEEEDEHEFVISYMDTSDTESTTSSEVDKWKS
jgi:hypothetical protein